MTSLDAAQLKEHIILNNQVGIILEALNCHHIKEYAAEYRAALPDKTNPTGVCVIKATLHTGIRTSDGERYGDIFFLAMEIRGSRFGATVRWLHKVLGLPYTVAPQTKAPAIDPLAIFKRVKRKRYRVNEPPAIYDASIIREYASLPHISWVREGITPVATQRFNIGYSFERKRIVIPERKWDGGENDYIGIMGRTTVPHHDLLDIPKYYPLQKYPKGMNVYGLNENYKAIQEAGRVVVFEAAKSVLKRYSRNDATAVSLGGSTVTEQQAKILISLNVEIVLALDKGLSQAHVWQQCEHFFGIRKVSYIWDTHNLLDDKESPADKPNKIYQYLHKYRLPYDENERKHLIRWQEKHAKS